MKLKNLFQKMDLWVERLVGYPGCDQKKLNTRKTIWIGTVIGIIHVIVHTLVFLIFFPQALNLLINYGLILLVILGFTLLMTPQLIRGFDLYFAVYLSALLLLTFYFILKLGGIATSCGLIFACLAFVLSSVPLQNMRITMFLFSLFAVVVILSGLLVPWLTVPKEITPSINAIVFVMNTVSMSLMILYLTFNFFSQQSQIEKLESEKLKEVNEAKSKLFTNITHEFRTQLTIIQGMANLIKNNPSEWIGKGTVKIECQTRNLLALVNHMLDLSKLETGAMPVHSIQSDIINYLRYLSDSFTSLAHSKKIQLKFIPGSIHFVMDFDPEKIMYIVSNLLSNALKYTPIDGTVEFHTSLSKNNNEFSIKVSDNGPGIPPEHLPSIFDRFYRIEDEREIKEAGSGLGLALVKELVLFLGGSINVISTPLSGTTFTVILPVTNNAPEKEIIPGENYITENLLHPNDTASNQDIYETDFSDSELPILLIVEDSSDLNMYLKALLQKNYRVEFALNGQLGLQKAFEHIPDIIVSDVMMPVMDGIKMLDILKNDIRTSHIPVVMLTAKADIDSRLTGLEKGADDYLAKPFNENELLIRLRKLIELRHILHDRYAAGKQIIPDQSLPENLEDAFIQRIRLVMEQNLDDDHFDVHQICMTLGMSRSQLYRKFKSLTNKSVIDYLWTLRLVKAKTLLLTRKFNVSEVAFAVGFKNLSHFSKAFKDQFGMNPSAITK